MKLLLTVMAVFCMLATSAEARQHHYYRGYLTAAGAWAVKATHRGYYRTYRHKARRISSYRQSPKAILPQSQIDNSNSYLIAFSGLGGAIDIASAQRIAAAQERTLKVFGYNETNKAVSFLQKQPEATHSLLGFSAGASDNVISSYIGALKKSKLSLPYTITTVGLYNYSPAYNSVGIPTINYIDHSGQMHAFQHDVINLGSDTLHLDPKYGAMAKVASLFSNVFRISEIVQTASISDIDDARNYLVKTAHPGGTMTQQTPQVAISLLHPVFAVRLANAIKQANSEGINAGLMSAYRPPIFGVGGFRDKFNSLHSYGLAVDMGGIGSPGSQSAQRWFKIAGNNGIYGPYGPFNRVEWNHYQLTPIKMATQALRKTITAKGPIQTALMWLASGIGLNDIEPTQIKQPVLMARNMARVRHIHYRYHIHHRYARV